MKYLVLVADGMTDRPIAELDGRTPLEAARTPNLDRLAAAGEVGLVETTPPGLDPGSDVGNLTIMGYDPQRYHFGRAPLEAAGRGVALEEGETVFRLNLVAFRDPIGGYDFEGLSPSTILEDHTAGGISDSEARGLIAQLNFSLRDDPVRFHPGKGYRHLMVWRGDLSETAFAPPHSRIGKEIDASFLSERESVQRLMRDAHVVLSGHPINRARRARGERPANGIWLWGAGRAHDLPSFRETYRKRGAMISAVDLLRGLGRKAGWEVVDVPGATGGIDTDYEGKVNAACGALKTNDLVYLHFEAPDEAGHAGDLAMKVEAIERFDRRIVGPLTSRMNGGGWRMLLLPDHATLLSTRDHVSDPVPYLLCHGEKREKTGQIFSEREAARTGTFWSEGFRLMNYFLGA